MSEKNKPRVPRTGLGVDVPIIGDGTVPKAVQDLIIAMFQEYVLPEFTKFNVVLEALAGRMEKLENDRRFVISLDPELMKLVGIKLLGTSYRMTITESEEKKDGNV